MRVVVAVLKDLTEFAFLGIRRQVLYLLSNKPPLLFLNAPLSTVNSHSAEVDSHSRKIPMRGVGQLMYSCVPSTPLLTAPVVSFDVCVDTLPYGSHVMVYGFEGRYARVRWEGIDGWVFKDDLVDEPNAVFPSFTEGEEYSALHLETKKVRACINDEYFGNEAQEVLSSAEYVTYRLYRMNQHIPWPPVRPRKPGMWQSILKGVVGVHLSISPKTGSVMEYRSEEYGQLAYVEGVSPDQVISISYIVESDQATYYKTDLPKEQWIELRPVFIVVV